MRNNIIYFLATAMLLFSSCENYLTKEIEFEDIGFIPQMVVNTNYNAETQFLDVSISKNLSYTTNGSQKFEFIEANNIVIKVDGEDKYEPLSEKPVGPGTQYYNYRFKIEEADITNKTFRLIADAKDYPSINAEFRIETAAKLGEIIHTEDFREVVFDGETYSVDNLKITLEDQDGVSNYFALEFLIGGQVVDIDINDPQVEMADNYRILFDDSVFLNGEKTLSIDISSDYFDEDLVLRYTNLSEQKYKYERSILNYQRGKEFGFFAEPVTVYTNINGGYGIFALDEIIEKNL